MLHFLNNILILVIFSFQTLFVIGQEFNSTENNTPHIIKREREVNKSGEIRKNENRNRDFREGSDNQNSIDKINLEQISPAVINLLVREKDVFKSTVVAKHFSQDSLQKIYSQKPERINDIEYYFNKSFTIELIPEIIKEQKTIDTFVSNFDPFQYEEKRKSFEREEIDFFENGVKVILHSKNELPASLSNALKKIKNKDCNNCGGERRIPDSSERKKTNK